MKNVGFATAIHILTLLAISGETLSSSYIAGSININPAMVRKSLMKLSSEGLVSTKEGKGGGVSLAKPADKIFLSDIYAVLNETALLGRLNSPNPQCTIGKQINNHLDSLYSNAEQALMNKLMNVSLAEFCLNFK